MKYMLMICVDPADVPEDEPDDVEPWVNDLDSRGIRLFGDRLRPPSDATTVRVRGGEVMSTDGPYAETKEQIAGFDVIECASLEDAVRWAGRHPHSWMGAVEVRALTGGAPVVHLPEPGAGKTRYMMFVCTDPAVDPREFARMEPPGPWVAEMDGRGVRLFGSELEPPGRARTVRVRDKHAIVTDGPFAGTKEQIAGFDVLECADLDEAIDVAAKHPMARVGILEVRPFRPLGED